MSPLSYDIEININISVEFNVGPPYWMRDWPVIRQESSKHKER